MFETDCAFGIAITILKNNFNPYVLTLSEFQTLKVLSAANTIKNKTHKNLIIQVLVGFLFPLWGLGGFYSPKKGYL